MAKVETAIGSPTFDLSYDYDDGAGDTINLTAITDTLMSANNQTFGYTDTNRIEETTGPWGSLDFGTDGVGNRTARVLDDGATTTTDVYARETGTNRIASVTTNSVLSRSFTHDDAGDVLTDASGGVTKTYGYSDAGRMEGLTVGSVAQGPYLYNGFGQLASRSITATPSRTLHMLYDQDGNLIAEADSVTGEILREYFWLGMRPVAVMDAAADGQIYAVQVDHLDRPVMMTDWSGALVWQAAYLPFGEVWSLSGSASLDYRFPGQWFMAETGLAYSWFRWYDASIGRYTQPDAIGMPDGPSRYAHALNSPLTYVDQDGEFVQLVIGAAVGAASGAVTAALTGQCYSVGDALIDAALGATGAGIAGKLISLGRATILRSYARSIGATSRRVTPGGIETFESGIERGARVKIKPPARTATGEQSQVPRGEVSEPGWSLL